MNSSHGYRFLKTNRLPNAAAFGRVFKKAKRSKDELFTVLYRSSEDNIARLGLAISKKNCRRATRRNRIKRTIRESFRQHQMLLSGLDIVVINQAAATAANGKTMRASLERHWQQCSKTRQPSRQTREQQRES